MHVSVPQTWYSVGRIQEQSPAGDAAVWSRQEVCGPAQSSGKRLHDEVTLAQSFRDFI
jgi:hypothetical protein